MALESVGELAIDIILSKLGPTDTAVVGCASKRFRVWASDDSLWSKFCSQDLDLSSPLDPLGNPSPSFKEAYQAWREAFAMYPWSLVKRVKRCWGRLTNWLTVNFPEAMSTLQKGASEDEIKELEKSLKVKLPLPTRVLYRFCDGQKLPKKKFGGGSMRGGSMGLIGGYLLYNDAVNVFLLPLKKAIKKTNYILRGLGFRTISKYIAVATSPPLDKKIFFLNCTNGQLYVGTRNLAADGEMIPCVPNELISSVHGSGSGQQQDALLLWLEENVRRLETGMVKLHDEGISKSINLFPEQPPLLSTTVTNGVQVRASAVFAPELSDLQHQKFVFTFSIRMSLLPEGCIASGISFDSCQLSRRHWIICANGNVVSDVEGEAVMGKYPLLHAGQREFVYESSTHLPSSTGSIEGSFTFVPGSLAYPRGLPFEVEVTMFPLQWPDYIF